MPLRCRELALACLLMLAASGCAREERRFSEPLPSSGALGSLTLSDLRPGVPAGRASAPLPYEHNAHALAEGQRLYDWFNCSGCHAHGGGAIGPPLMDDEWIYGSEPRNVFATIVQGRPNGMPAFGGRIPEQQVWQLVAYVRSLSGQASKPAAPGRTDDMQTAPPPQATPRAAPQPSAVPSSAER